MTTTTLIERLHELATIQKQREVEATFKAEAEAAELNKILSSLTTQVLNTLDLAVDEEHVRSERISSRDFRFVITLNHTMSQADENEWSGTRYVSRTYTRSDDGSFLDWPAWFGFNGLRGESKDNLLSENPFNEAMLFAATGMDLTALEDKG